MLILLFIDTFYYKDKDKARNRLNFCLFADLHRVVNGLTSFRF